LRHSAAVAWLESGVHIKAVADLLGHSSISITGDIYGHTSDETATLGGRRLERGTRAMTPNMVSIAVALSVALHTLTGYPILHGRGPPIRRLPARTLSG
jgi:hypothetical protein